MRDGRICGGKHSLIAGISSAFATHIYNKSRLLLPNPKPYYEGCRKKNFLQGRIIARLPAQFILPQPPSHGRCIEGNPQQKREDRAGQRGIACRQLKEQPSAQPKTKPTRLIGQPRLYARTEKAPRRQSEPVAEAALSSPMHKGESQLQI